LQDLILNEEGQDLVEYSLIILIIASAATACVGGLSGIILSYYNYINAHYP
jgi:Flp pilus assembly pilin Flp